MKRFAVLAFAVLAIAPLVRADEWSKTYTVTGPPELRVETSDANIRVDTWDQNTIEARVTTNRYKIGERGIQVIEHQNGNSVDLEVRYPHHNFVIQFGTYRVDVEIHMPREGKVTLRTGDGSMELRGLKGDMELQTGDGHQEITSVDGNLRARSGDGHIEATGRFDRLDLETGDGRINARALAGSAVVSDWTLHTGDGSVTLQLPETIAADIDLRTSDGHVTADIPVSVEGRLGEKNIRGKINGGGREITVHTGDGSIRLEKL